MHLKQALSSAIAQLEANDVGSPRLNAETLLMFVLGVNRAYLYAHPERELTSAEQSRYQEALAQRSTGMPSQYITGHQEFWRLDLIVSPAVLIPRPETEHIVETVLEILRGEQNAFPSPRASSSAPAAANEAAVSPASSDEKSSPDSASQQKLKIVDVGTGSGCIALALAHELPLAEVHALDISADALEIAKANAARLQLASRITFAQSNVLAALSDAGEFDFVTSNPPYVGYGEADKVQKSVQDYEPRVAVFSGEDGLDIIRPLIEQSRRVLKAEGWLVMEIGYSMLDAVVSLFASDSWQEVKVVPDLQGIPRVVAAKKRP